MRKNKRKLFSQAVLFIFILNFILSTSGISNCIWVTSSATQLSEEKASVTITLNQANVKKGDKITATINVSSNSNIAGVQGEIHYNSQLLEYVEGDGNGTDGVLTILDWDTTGTTASKTKKYILTFKAKEVGTAFIGKADDSYTVIDENSDEMEVSIQTVTLNIQESIKVSSDNTLSELKVAGYKLQPDFSPDVLSYTIQVTSDVNKLVLSATPKNLKGIVKVQGNSNFKSGDNKVEIIVSAESGAKKTYTITVSKGTSDESTNTPNNSDIITGNENGVQFLIIHNQKYIVREITTDLNIPANYEISNVEISGNQYTVLKNFNNEDIVLFYLSKEGSEQADFYAYNFAEDTFTLYTEGDIMDVTTQQGIEGDNVDLEEKGDPSGFKSLIIPGIILLAVIGITTVAIFINKRKIK